MPDMTTRQSATQTTSKLNFVAMGVKGLSAVLAEYLGQRAAESLPVEAQFAIDGPGLAFFIYDCKNGAPWCSSEPLARRFGGDYSGFHRRICLFFSMLGASAVTVYWDGPALAVKSAELEKRASQRRRELENLQKHCMYGDEYDETEYPLPPSTLIG